MVDFWGPEAARGHSRPKRGKKNIAARVGAHVCYSLPRFLAGPRAPSPRAPGPGHGPGVPLIWVNYSIHGPRPGPTCATIKNFFFPRFGLEWPRAASGPKKSTINRICGRIFSSFIKFYCNRTMFDPCLGSGGRGAHVCYSLPSLCAPRPSYEEPSTCLLGQAGRW